MSGMHRSSEEGHLRGIKLIQVPTMGASGYALSVNASDNAYSVRAQHVHPTETTPQTRIEILAMA